VLQAALAIDEIEDAPDGFLDVVFNDPIGFGQPHPRSWPAVTT